MNKTLYLPDDEAETWEKARRLANDRLSPVILKALKEYIMTKQAEASEAAGFERIELEYDDSDDSHLPKRKAFRGQWIFPPEDALHLPGTKFGDDQSRAYAVGVTAKGNVVVYMWKCGAKHDYGHRFLVFPSFEEAALGDDLNHAIREAVRKRGVPVEELDI
ncbi:MAG: hypothetical protein ABSF12_26300 [Bryobacteraceae bacterium]